MYMAKSAMNVTPEQKLQELKEELEKNDIKVLLIKANIEEETEIKKMIKESIKYFLDIPNVSNFVVYEENEIIDNFEGEETCYANT